METHVPSAAAGDPYDEVPYWSRPIEWSAPEHLALCALLHAGPRPPLAGYDVLELGCGDGSNLLSLAYYRRHARFVGIDRSADAVALANARRAEVGLDNVRFLHADFAGAARQLDDVRFDYIIAHGVFSWVAAAHRDALLALCAARLAPAGLLYLNYNSKPGWNVRGMVRDFLRAQTAGIEGLAERARVAQGMAAAMAESFDGVNHPYCRLMQDECRFVCQGHPSYVAHEFLAPENHAYWRREFLELLAPWSLRYVGDADFNRDSGRTRDELIEGIVDAGLAGQPIADTIDLLCYRQHHAPVLTHVAAASRPIAGDEIARLFLASPLRPLPATGGDAWHFQHPSGHQVNVTAASINDALLRLAPLWPKGVRLGELFADVAPAWDDLRLYHRYGMIDLRAVEPETTAADAAFAATQVRWWGGPSTTPLHRMEAGE